MPMSMCRCHFGEQIAYPVVTAAEVVTISFLPPDGTIKQIKTKLKAPGNTALLVTLTWSRGCIDRQAKWMGKDKGEAPVVRGSNSGSLVIECLLSTVSVRTSSHLNVLCQGDPTSKRFRVLRAARRLLDPLVHSDGDIPVLHPGWWRHQQRGVHCGDAFLGRTARLDPFRLPAPDHPV